MKSSWVQGVKSSTAVGAAVFLALVFVCATESRAGDDRDDKIKSTVTLNRTDAAPEGAKGKARLDGRRRDDAVSGRVKVEVINLAPGKYTVTLSDSGGGSNVLGDLTVKERGESDEKHEHKSKTDLKFDSINPLGVTTISVADETGVEMLVGDFSTGLLDLHVKAKAPIVAVGAPDAEGRAEVHGHQKGTNQKGHFHLKAAGLPADTAVVLNIDGVDAISATTDSHGHLRIRRTAEDLNIFTISTVSIRDEFGMELATVQF